MILPSQLPCACSNVRCSTAFLPLWKFLQPLLEVKVIKSFLMSLLMGHHCNNVNLRCNVCALCCALISTCQDSLYLAPVLSKSMPDYGRRLKEVLGLQGRNSGTSTGPLDMDKHGVSFQPVCKPR